MTIDALFEAYRTLIDDRLNVLFPSDSEKASKAARYSLLNGGKRIRPIILLEFYKLCGGKGNEALNFAAALEMIHTYSLIHDDLPCMDNDDMRRGKPSCHKAFGEDNALLAGDALLTSAFAAAAKTEQLPGDRVVKSISVLADRAGIFGMVGGQAIDLALEEETAGAEILLEMYRKKTGCLLEAAAEIGCILAGADDNTVENAREYAENVGLAFQIIDDILDCTADEQVLGKPVGSDVKNGKETYVTLYGIGQSRTRAAEFSEKAITSLERIDGDKINLLSITEYLLNRKY